MVLVLFFLGILVLLISVIILIIVSTLHIQIKNLSVSNMKPKNKAKYAIIISLYLGNKIKWIWFNLNDKRMKKMYSKIQLEKLDFQKLKKDLKQLPKLKPKISYLNLDANLGVIDPTATSFLVAIIATIISLLLPYLATDLKEKNYIYNIKPLYYNQNLYKVNVDCIIEIKMVHIINVIYYILIKKGRKKNDQSTTSNRKSYAYSYE